VIYSRAIVLTRPEAPHGPFTPLRRTARVLPIVPLVVDVGWLASASAAHAQTPDATLDIAFAPLAQSRGDHRTRSASCPNNGWISPIRQAGRVVRGRVLPRWESSSSRERDRTTAAHPT
jgi:hypothetical protein